MRCTLYVCLYVVVFIVGLTSDIHSQTPAKTPVSTPDIETLFETAAVKHKRELQDLLATRGAALIELPNATSKSIAKLLGIRNRVREGCREATYAEHTAVLFYSYRAGSLIVWLVDEQGIKGYSKRTASETEINRAISAHRTLLGVNALHLAQSGQGRGISFPDDSGPALAEATKDLTDILLPRAIADAMGQVKHLIVVPVLGIGTVPFPLLRPFGSDSFLIDKMSVTIAPSLFDIGQTVESIECWDTDRSEPLVIGDPNLVPDQQWGLPALPGARTEAQGVAAMLETKALLDKEATKQTVVSRSGDATILYFASHAAADNADPLNGGFLALSAGTFKMGCGPLKKFRDPAFVHIWWF
jgi:CHAT domain